MLILIRGGIEMVLNNYKKDVKIKCLQAEISQEKLAEKIGTTGQYVSRVIGKDQLVNKVFVQMMEALGYDIELTYVKRDA